MESVMPSRRPALVLAALSSIAVWILPPQAQSEEYHCRRGDLVRRVEVQFADSADRLPCQVVYWRDADSSERPRVPWNADHQLEFCFDKAREMVDRLQSAGWTCDGDSPLSEDAAELDKASERSSRAPAAADAPPAGADAPLAAPSPDATTNGPSKPDQATLEAALARDLRRLDELAGELSGGFEPDMAILGDLDGDGVEDGAALLSHRAEDGASSHHLLAYLFDGRTFRPVARVNLEAYYQNFTNVALEDIADGGIELLLHMPKAGDPACCPSGRRLATFELRDGQLVLAAESDSGA
jgi:hypothetical protein